MKCRSILTLSALLGILALTAAADTTIKSTIENKGLGGVMDMKGTQQLMISGDKAKTLSDVKMTNQVMKLLGGGKPQQIAEITRLDKELFWNVNLKDKEYTELTFAEMRAQFEKGLKEAKKAKTDRAEDTSDDSIQVTTEVKIDNTGQSKTIAGYKADEVVVTMLFKGTDTASGKTSTMKMVMDIWLAKDVPGHQEYENYNKSLAEKLGFTGRAQGNLDQALQGFGIDPKDVYEKMKGVEGMPLMTVVSLLPEGLDSALAAAEDSAKKAEEQEKAQPSEDDDEQSTDVKSKGLKKLGGLFGKKKDAEKEEAAKNEGKAGEPPYLFHMTTVVTEISATPIPASEFEVPQNFKKVSK